MRSNEMTPKSLKKFRRTQMKDHDSLITLLDKEGREIRDPDKIIERMDEFYTELHDCEQNTIYHTDPNDVPEITS